MTNPTREVPVELLERITFPYTAIETVYVERQIAIDELRALLAQPADHLPPLIQCLRENGQQIAERAFDAQEAKYPQVEHPGGAQVPEGWKLVPIQPTEEMRRRAQDYLAAEGIIVSDWLIHTSYTEMLAAAPKAPEGREDAFELMREALRKVSDRLEAFIDDEMDMPHSSMEVCKGICDAALSAAQAGEVKP